MVDYYHTLGIEKNADLKRIKHAYRFLCKKYHPDVADPKEHRRFLTIKEAYDTLTNHEKRREYDRDLMREERHVPASLDEGGSPDRRWAAREPDGFSFFERIRRDALWFLFPKPHTLSLELILTPAEARRGGNYALEVPWREPCPACGGGGGYAFQVRCVACGGTGYAHKRQSVILRVPSNSVSGLRAEIILNTNGMQHTLLHVELLVR